MKTVDLHKSLTAGSANCIAQSQSLAAAGDLILNGASVVAGEAVLDTARRIQIVSGGNDSGKTASVYGYPDSSPSVHLLEVLPLTNAGTVASDVDFMRISRIAVSAAAATTLTVGTNTTGSTPWVMPNYHLTPFNVHFVMQQSGSATWNLETTQDDYWTPGKSQYDETPQVPVSYVIQGSTIAQDTTLTAAVTGWRYTITAGTGTITVESTQAGITNLG